MSDKIYSSAQEALFDVIDGASIMSGGFGLCANAENSISELVRRGVKDLTIISNNCGNQGRGLAELLKERQVKKVIGSYIGGNPDLQEQMFAGNLEVELNPQGTLAERIRAGGAGLGGFFTPTGIGTEVAEGKEIREIEGRQYVFEKPLTADFAIIRARVGDSYGNLRFYGTGRNFSPLMGTAARVTIAEVEELVPVGELGPDDIHLPGVFVQRVFQGRDYQNWVENLTVRSRES
jgi:3-oxoacid CoA-transferase subunit A